MKFLHIVWRNLMRRKIRTIFTLLSIFVAFVLFGFLMAVRSAFSMGIDLAGADRLMVLNKISIIMPLPSSYSERIRRSRGSRTSPTRTGSAATTRRRRTSSRTWRSTPRAGCAMYPEFAVPEDQNKAWLADRQGAIVGADLAKRFGWKVGDRVPLQATIFSPARSAGRGSSTSPASTTRR